MFLFRLGVLISIVASQTGWASEPRHAPPSADDEAVQEDIRPEARSIEPVNRNFARSARQGQKGEARAARGAGSVYVARESYEWKLQNGHIVYTNSRAPYLSGSADNPTVIARPGHTFGENTSPSGTYSYGGGNVSSATYPGYSQTLPAVTSFRISQQPNAAPLTVATNHADPSTKMTFQSAPLASGSGEWRHNEPYEAGGKWKYGGVGSDDIPHLFTGKQLREAGYEKGYLNKGGADGKGGIEKIDDNATYVMFLPEKTKDLEASDERVKKLVASMNGQSTGTHAPGASDSPAPVPEPPAPPPVADPPAAPPVAAGENPGDPVPELTNAALRLGASQAALADQREELKQMRTQAESDLAEDKKNLEFARRNVADAKAALSQADKELGDSKSLSGFFSKGPYDRLADLLYGSPEAARKKSAQEAVTRAERYLERRQKIADAQQGLVDGLREQEQGLKEVQDGLEKAAQDVPTDVGTPDQANALKAQMEEMRGQTDAAVKASKEQVGKLQETAKTAKEDAKKEPGKS